MGTAILGKKIEGIMVCKVFKLHAKGEDVYSCHNY